MIELEVNIKSYSNCIPYVQKLSRDMEDIKIHLLKMETTVWDGEYIEQTKGKLDFVNLKS